MSFYCERSAADCSRLVRAVAEMPTGRRRGPARALCVCCTEQRPRFPIATVA
jgi:hypothetical protein